MIQNEMYIALNSDFLLLIFLYNSINSEYGKLKIPISAKILKIFIINTVEISKGFCIFMSIYSAKISDPTV